MLRAHQDETQWGFSGSGRYDFTKVWTDGRKDASLAPRGMPSGTSVASGPTPPTGAFMRSKPQAFHSLSLLVCDVLHTLVSHAMATRSPVVRKPPIPHPESPGRGCLYGLMCNWSPEVARERRQKPSRSGCFIYARVQASARTWYIPGSNMITVQSSLQGGN